MNRNLQVTFLAGAVFLAVLSDVPTISAALQTFGWVDLCKLAALVGLPTMLFGRGGKSRELGERIVAQGTASLVCAFVLVHTFLAGSAVPVLYLALSFVVMAQVSWMRRTDKRAQPCT